MSYQSTSVDAIQLSPMRDTRGVLLPIEFTDETLPFLPVRSFIISDMSPGVPRAGHASTNCDEVIVLISGEIEITVDNGSQTQKFLLDKCGAGLIVSRMHWLSIVTHSSNTQLWVMASQTYANTHYIKERDTFREYVANNPNE